MQTGRRLQSSDPAIVTVVSSSKELSEALKAPTSQHIEITRHLDLTEWHYNFGEFSSVLFLLDADVKTIRGDCKGDFPSSEALQFPESQPDLLPHKPGQCLLLLGPPPGTGTLNYDLYFDNAGRVKTPAWMSNLYLRSLAETGNRRSVVTARELYMTNVTLQGSGAFNRGALLTSNRLFAEDCIFADWHPQGADSVVEVHNNATSLRRCTFQGNTVTAESSVVSYKHGGSVRMEQCRFIGNSNDDRVLHSKDHTRGASGFFSDKQMPVALMGGQRGQTKSLSDAPAGTFLSGTDISLLVLQEEALAGRRVDAIPKPPDDLSAGVVAALGIGLLVLTVAIIAVGVACQQNRRPRISVKIDREKVDVAAEQAGPSRQADLVAAQDDDLNPSHPDYVPAADRFQQDLVVLPES